MPATSFLRKGMRIIVATFLTIPTTVILLQIIESVYDEESRFSYTLWTGSTGLSVETYLRPSSCWITLEKTQDTEYQKIDKLPSRFWGYEGFGFALSHDETYEYLSISGVYRVTEYGVRVPVFLLVLVLGLYPYLVLVHRPLRRARRRRYGLCEHCNHDLHGSTLPVCPECGERVPESGVRILNTLLEEQRKTNDLLGRLAAQTPAAKRNQSVTDQTSSTSGDHP